MGFVVDHELEIVRQVSVGRFPDEKGLDGRADRRDTVHDIDRAALLDDIMDIGGRAVLSARSRTVPGRWLA